MSAHSPTPITIIFLDTERHEMLGVDHVELTPQQIADPLYLHRTGVERHTKLFPDFLHVRIAFARGHLTFEFARDNLPPDIYGLPSNVEEWQSTSGGSVVHVNVAVTKDRN